jgi:hypothetical protein
MREETMPEFEHVAHQFAAALVHRDYVLAQSLLSDSLQATHPPEKLQQLYTEMLAYTDGAVADTTEVVTTMTEWPTKQAEDIGWAYVAINGQIFSEGVAVTVINEGGQPRIRDVIWGRP